MVEEADRYGVEIHMMEAKLEEFEAVAEENREMKKH